jgi:hypothetical protein
MAIVKSRRSREEISLSGESVLKAVRVLDIILDINHPLAEKKGNYDSVGTIFYTNLDDNLPYISSENAPSATPLFTHLKYYPLINEIVLVLTTNDNNPYDGKTKTTYYLPQVNMWGHPHHNALPFKFNNNNSNINNYKESESGLIRKEEENTPITLGNYFKEQTNIKPLLPYEGDMILEGRFGNSIRFGSTNNDNNISNPNNWSDVGNTGDPITIIRNGQSSNLDNKGWLPTIENIGEDASNIYLTSNQRIRNFKQASPHMESFNAIYIEPQSLEQSLLNPNPSPKVLTNDPESTTTPLPNKDIDLSGTDVTPGLVEKPELKEIEDNPKTTNESENSIENRGVQYTDDIKLPSSYVDPGSGGKGPGASSEFETNI